MKFLKIEIYTDMDFGIRDGAREEQWDYDVSFPMLKHETPSQAFLRWYQSVEVLNTNARHHKFAKEWLETTVRELYMEPDGVYKGGNWELNTYVEEVKEPEQIIQEAFVAAGFKVSKEKVKDFISQVS